jgi:protein-S-isoprenylcysteine O-methyltransferase Ste14
MGSYLAIGSEFEAAGGRRMWRVRNVPLPEPHLLGMAIGGWLHHLRPWMLPASRNISRLVGCSLIAFGTCVIARSMGAAGPVSLDGPERLVTSGPYAVSRNPMYVGWALLHVGAGMSARSGWMLVAFPLAAARVHHQILQEERELGEKFPAEYARYRGEVPRYFPGS